jgi:hypothetical protein
MIDKTLNKLVESIQVKNALTDSEKKDVLSLLDELRNEVNLLSTTHQKEAESIVTNADISMNHALDKDANLPLPDFTKLGPHGSLEQFEESHPKLLATINDFCTRLSSLGV